MKNHIFIFIIFVCMISIQTIFSQVEGEYMQGVDIKKTGQSSMNFLQVGIVAQATAMGDAYSAIGQGARSIFYNPAGLAEINSQYEVFLSTMEWIADIRYIAAAGAWNMQNIGTLGFSFLTVDYGDIIGTELIPIEMEGEDQLGYRETGMVDNVGAYALGFAFARNITTDFKIGLSARYAMQQLGRSQIVSGGSWQDNNESTATFDLGVKYYTPIKSLCMGMSMRNFAPEIKYEEVSTHLPLTFALALAMDVMDLIEPEGEKDNSLLASIEMTHPNNYTERVHMGLDYNYRGILSIRGGYITNHDVAGLSLGFGISADLMGTKAEINYSYSNMDVFDDVSRFAVVFAF